MLRSLQRSKRSSSIKSYHLNQLIKSWCARKHRPSYIHLSNYQCYCVDVGRWAISLRFYYQLWRAIPSRANIICIWRRRSNFPSHSKICYLNYSFIRIKRCYQEILRLQISMKKAVFVQMCNSLNDLVR